MVYCLRRSELITIVNNQMVFIGGHFKESGSEGLIQVPNMLIA